MTAQFFFSILYHFFPTDPPGPIDNSMICMIKNKVAFVRPHSDYGQVSDEAWQFLYNRYGGGPVLLLYPAAPTPNPDRGESPVAATESENETWSTFWGNKRLMIREYETVVGMHEVFFW